MSNLTLLPNSNWDDADWMHHINIQQGFEELHVDKKGRLYSVMTEKGEKEAYDFWLKRCLEDQEEDRKYAEANGMTLEEYYEEYAQEALEEEHWLGQVKWFWKLYYRVLLLFKKEVLVSGGELEAVLGADGHLRYRVPQDYVEEEV